MSMSVVHAKLDSWWNELIRQYGWVCKIKRMSEIIWKWVWVSWGIKRDECINYQGVKRVISFQGMNDRMHGWWWMNGWQRLTIYKNEWMTGYESKPMIEWMHMCRPLKHCLSECVAKQEKNSLGERARVRIYEWMRKCMGKKASVSNWVNR